jgi:two-component system phosphate regulon sensor histidine kinase PhoR
MKAQKNLYRKNFSLITAFLVLITVSLVIAVIISYNLTAKYVENEFASKKIEVLDQTVKPYNDFFQLKDPRDNLLPGFPGFGIGGKLFGYRF